jgi:hypothetical protein
MRDIVAGRTISRSANAVTEIGPFLSMTDKVLRRSGVMPAGSSMCLNCLDSRENRSWSSAAISPG